VTDDPDREMSIIYDNRSRIALRVQQLKTGKRYAQTPPSSVRRMISNIEMLEQEGDHVLVGANFLAVESRPRRTVLWAGRTEYRLRREGGTFRLARKTVTLVDRVVRFAQSLRKADLKKAPGIAEVVDWAVALVAVSADGLSSGVLRKTLGALLKNRDDVERVLSDPSRFRG